MVRLRRWLGSSKSKRKLRQLVAVALDVCPERFHRQPALLHIVNGDFEAAAKLLASAAGLGWSGSEHPGYSLFPIFHTLLRGAEPITEVTPDLDEQDLVFNCDGPRLETPKIGALLDQAGIDPPADCTTRAAVLEAMRKAAARRIEGVTENKRRRYYAHAASLALACVRVDGWLEAVSWLAVIRNQYRRYTALQREFALRPS